MLITLIFDNFQNTAIEPKQILYVCFMRDQLMPETMGNPIETVGVVKSISARIILLHQTTNGTNIEKHLLKP